MLFEVPFTCHFFLLQACVQEAFLFDWASKLPLPEFALRLAGVFGVFFLTLGLPISGVSTLCSLPQ